MKWIKNNRKVIALLFSIVVVIIILINSTYSLLFRTDETELQSYTTGILEITSSTTNNSVTLTNSLPMEDADGELSTPYTFKITNTGNLNYKFNVMLLSTTATNQIDASYIKVKVNNEALVSLNTLTNGTILEDITLEPGDSVEVTLRVWLDYYTPNSQIGKVFNAKIVTEGQAIYTNMPSSDLAIDTLTNLGFTPEEQKLTTFTTTSKLDGTTGIYEAKDDLGTSYYFRGNVTNNYVKFGKYTEDAYQIINNSTTPAAISYASTCISSINIVCTKIASAGDDMYWRIIRINGDGTVRLIYDGTNAFANGDDSKNVDNNSIGYSAYNTSYNDNAYVGYMYGTTGSTTYEATHANTNSSDLKLTIDAWYEKYLNTNYSTYIADAIYCNDRTRVTDTAMNQMQGATGEGFGTYVTLYSFSDRIAINNVDMSATITPTLKCGQQNDRFTKNSNVGNVSGNDKLTYPVGTITIDEVTFAGGNWYFSDTYINDEYYLFSNYSYWSLTPAEFNAGRAVLFRVNGGLISSSDVHGGGVGVGRPVITLNSNVLKHGTGIMTDPFIIWQLGDINRDGSLTSDDLDWLSRALINVEILDSEQRILADMNEDGEIRNSDLIILARLINEAIQ